MTLAVAEGRGKTWRPLGESEPSGPKCVAECKYGRCNIDVLLPFARYCFYHQSVVEERITVHMEPKSGGWEQVSARNVYPVWPLPSGGYVLIGKEE